MTRLSPPFHARKEAASPSTRLRTQPGPWEPDSSRARRGSLSAPAVRALTPIGKAHPFAMPRADPFANVRAHGPQAIRMLAPPFPDSGRGAVTHIGDD